MANSTLPSDSGGKTMPEDVQAKMEGAFGTDFSAVRIHEGPQATAMGALAYTQGTDIHFAPGQYAPGSQRGQELLGHELTHVMQQSQGRVQATRQAKGIGMNDDARLEREADEMGARAARAEWVSGDGRASNGAERMAGIRFPGNTGSSYPQKVSSNAKPRVQIKKGPIQRKVFKNDEEKEQFFTNYRKRAEAVLADWYEKTKTKNGRDQLTGAMFEKAARKIYAEKGDSKFIVPVEFALAQARLEGGVSRKERLGQGNIFNVGAYDSGVTNTEKKVNSLGKGFDAYYNFMANEMLDDKSPEQLLQKGNFTKGADRTGGVYATNPMYEGHIKGEIGKMNMKDAGFKLAGTVGIGAKNNPADVEKVGKLLAKLGYLAEGDIKDAGKVGDAILKFQKTEIAPQGEKWFKDRMKEVTNPIDQTNIQKQINLLSDGIASNKGTTLGVIYYMAEMGGKVRTEGGVTDGTNGNTDMSRSSTSQSAETSGSTASTIASGNNLTPLMPVSSINKSVGKNGKNNRSDVLIVQTLLVKHGYLAPTNSKGASNIDGDCGPITEGAITKFQAKETSLRNPDGRVDPNGTTWASLTGKPVTIESKNENTNTSPTEMDINPRDAATSVIVQQFLKFNAGHISMPDLARFIKPYAKSHSYLVVMLFDNLDFLSQDNFAYALAANSSTAELAAYDRALLLKMRKSLNTLLTLSRDENMKQKVRIDAVLGTGSGASAIIGLAAITPSISALTTFAGTNFIGEEIQCDVEFLDMLRAIDDYAGKHGVRIYVTDSFRKIGEIVEGAIVTPATNSNHHAGHAIDMNVKYKGVLYNSTALKKFASLPQAVKNFLNDIRSDSRLRWGGDFSTPDVVHIDDGLNLSDEKAFKLRVNAVQSAALKK